MQLRALSFRTGLLALLVLQAPSASAVDRPGSLAPVAGQASLATILVTDAQRIALRFSEIPRLNGDYRVNADETVTVPGIGRISVAGLTAPALEKTLAERATGLSGREIYVTVEVAEYKPVFVTGRVARFGPIPWQPGLTVEQAVAVVGGLARNETGDRDRGGSLERRKAKLDQQWLLAVIARLRAEQQGSERLSVPDQLAKLGAKEAQALIDGQSLLMQNRRSALKKQLDVFAAGKALALQELDSLRLQKSRIEDQLKLRRQQRDRIQPLLDQKLTVADRALEEAIKVSDLEEKSANISVAVARVQATISNFDRDALNATENRKTEIDAELVRVERELAQVTATLDEGESVVAGLAMPVGSERPSYVISRRGSRNNGTIPATAGTPLMPGDVLLVVDPSMVE